MRKTRVLRSTPLLVVSARDPRLFAVGAAAALSSMTGCVATAAPNPASAATTLEDRSYAPASAVLDPVAPTPMRGGSAPSRSPVQTPFVQLTPIEAISYDDACAPRALGASGPEDEGELARPLCDADGYPVPGNLDRKVTEEDPVRRDRRR